jgi:hypothetical protein
MGTGQSHKPNNHSAAKANEEKLQLFQPDAPRLEKTRRHSRFLGNFVNLLDQDEACVKDPTLADKLVFTSFKFDHEQDIASGLILSAVKDAIDILNICDNVGRNLSTYMERSLFSVRPDVMVVRDAQRKGVLAIEVKRPDNQGILHCRILGQVYDQVRALQAFDKGASIVIVTNFEKTCMCSVDKSVFEDGTTPVQPSSNMQCQSKDSVAPPTAQASKSPLEAAIPPQSLKMSPKPFDFSQSPPRMEAPPYVLDEPHGVPRTVSAEDNSPSKSSTSSVAFQSRFIAEKDRSMWRSQEFEPNKLVQLIYTALKVALRRENQPPKTMYELEHGKKYSVEAIRVSEGKKSSYEWGKLEFKLGENVSYDTTSTDTAFYIIGQLGNGLTSNVFHAVKSNGEEVALKVYLLNVDENGNLMSQEQFLKVAENATENEVSNFRTLYPRLKVRQIEIFGRHGIEMPVFKPISKETRRDEDVQKAVKAVLDSFAKNSLKYKDCDVRWHHVGKYTDNKREKYILYDLADLLNTKGEGDAFVAGHLDTLKERSEDR